LKRRVRPKVISAHQLLRVDKAWGDLHLDESQPFVLAPASITKNRKDAKLPLRPEVVQALRSIRPTDAAPFQWVFHGHVPRMSTLRRDLKTAGISYVDDSGRRVDFHAFRVTLATLLAIAGVPLAEIARIMRHSDPKLTMKIYTDATKWDLSASLAMLPTLNVREPATHRPRIAL